MNLQKGMVTALAAGTIFLSNLLTPLALADTSVTVSGNGAVSDNSVTLDQSTNTSVNQTNTAEITNVVSTSSNTGGNDANFNTGGTTAISTGDASNTTNITTDANANIADLGGCNTCSTGGTGSITISGNGAFSDNSVSADSATNTDLSQTNVADITNEVYSNANTGDNKASFNTGGDTMLITGNASSNTSITNMANANVANVPGGGGGAGFGAVVIAGNGAESDNAVTLNNETNTSLSQTNLAEIANEVSSNMQTGDNKASFNTGGDVLLSTGNATSNTTIDNMANFNFADLTACGCITTGHGTIAIFGNGAFSDNSVSDNLGSNVSAEQTNLADIVNEVGGQDGLWLERIDGNGGGTGDNSAKFNTGGATILLTGNESNTTDLSTSANVNEVSNGNSLGFNMAGMNIQFLFDLNSLMTQLHL